MSERRSYWRSFWMARGWLVEVTNAILSVPRKSDRYRGCSHRAIDTSGRHPTETESSLDDFCARHDRIGCDCQPRDLDLHASHDALRRALHHSPAARTGPETAERVPGLPHR